MASKNSSSSNNNNNKDESKQRATQEQAAVAAAALKCPRCDSQNTKFCYYNNYSLTQPRHFCKTCRRYWTKGGALRNVPIGGGCRKNRRTKPSIRLMGNLDPKEGGNSISASGGGGAATDIGGLKFFTSFTPAMDFQHGGLSFPRLQPPSPTPPSLYTQFSSFGDISNPSFSLDLPSRTTSSALMGFNFPLMKQGENCNSVHEIGSSSTHHHQHPNTSLAIESLSSMNQDLHWKLQQQRLSMLFGNNEANNNEVHQKPQPILFETLNGLNANEPGAALVLGDDDRSGSRKEGNGGASLSTEWFFDNSYAPVTPTPTGSSGGGGGGDGARNDHPNVSWNNGIHGWGNLNQY